MKKQTTRRRQPAHTAGPLTSSWKALAGVALIIAAVILIVVGLTTALTTENEVSISTHEDLRLTPTMIRSIEDIGQWEFLSVRDEELVDTTRHNFFRDDQLVRIYYGNLRIGLDLHHLQEGWAEAHGDTIEARLPAISLLSQDFIDEARTKSVYEQGKWSNADRKVLYDKAIRLMRQRCLTADNIRLAQQRAEDGLTQVFQSLGFKQVNLTFEPQTKAK